MQATQTEKRARAPFPGALTIDARIHAAYNMVNYDDAKKSLELTVRYLERFNPSAARSLQKDWRKHS